MATLKNSNQVEYDAWRSMHYRCKQGPDAWNYKIYGSRGIKVCKRWEKFENFFADMGKRPSKKHTIDRINNKKGYSPSNCRWATRKEQSNNQRRSLIVTINGVTYPSVIEAHRVLKIGRNVIMRNVKIKIPGFSMKRKYPRGYENAEY